MLPRFSSTSFPPPGCKKVFHPRCIEASLTIGCQEVSGVGKENASPSSKKPKRLDQEDNWNVTRTSEFIDKSDEVIKDADELRRLEEFITRKVRKRPFRNLQGFHFLLVLHFA